MKKIHVPPIAVHVFWDPAVKRFTLWVHRYQILISCCRRARISNTQNRQSTHCFCFDILTKANTRDGKYYQSHTKLSSPYSSDHHDPHQGHNLGKIKGTRFTRLAPHPLSNYSLDKQYWQETFKSLVLYLRCGCFGLCPQISAGVIRRYTVPDCQCRIYSKSYWISCKNTH